MFSPPLKRKLLNWHSWVGVYLLVLLLIQLLSGLVISLRWELTDILYRPAVSALTPQGSTKPLSAGTIVTVLQAAEPEMRVERLYFPRHSDSPYLLKVVDGKSHSFVAMNPYDGSVIAAGGWLAFPVEAALALHQQPLRGPAGNAATAVIGLSLLSMVLTGLIFGWPKQGRWRQQYQVRWSSPARIWVRQLHKAIGFCLAPLALLIVISGLVMVLELGLAAVYARPPDVGSESTPLPATTIDAAVSLARSQFPDGQLRDIKLLANQDLVVQAVAAGNDPWAIHRVTVAANSLHIVGNVPAHQNPAWWASVLPFHTGTILGVFGRIVIMATGIGLLSMAALGFIAWRQRLP